MKKRLNDQLKLQEELKKFGLNPKDWILQTVGSHSFIIQNKEDTEFKFKGKIENTRSKITWKSLEFFSA